MAAMRWVLMSAALGAGLLAGCDKAKDPVEKSTGTTPSGASVPTPPPPPTLPLSSTATKSKDNQPPIQGQVDPKEPAQRRDFETKR